MASINHRGSSPLGYENAYHLLRRACYNVTKERIDQFAALSVDQALDSLFNYNDFDFNELIESEPRRFDDGSLFMDAGEQLSPDPNRNLKVVSIRQWFLNEASHATTIRFKLSFFLHSIFVTKFGTNYKRDFDILNLQMFYTKRSFKEFARKAAVDNSMHVYLNNNLNSAVNPNENFSREFLELFTITKSTQVGPNDYTTYTELDVQQAARVMTGFTIRRERDIIDAETGIPTGRELIFSHDTGNKTFSHRFGNQTITGASTANDMKRELDDFVDMIFAQDFTAVTLARRLFRFFVHGQISAEVETDIIQPLATTLRTNNYNLEVGLRQLLASQHFYDEDDTLSGNENKGGLIKTPIDLFLHTTNLFKIDYDSITTQRINNYRYFYSMAYNYLFKTTDLLLFQPTTVAGFTPIYQEPDYDRQWVSVNTLINRYNLGLSLIDGRDRISGTNGLIQGTFDALEFLENSGYFTSMLNNLQANPFANSATEMPNLMNAIIELAYVKPLSTDRYNELYNVHLLGALSEINWGVEWKNYKEGVTNGEDIELSINNVFLAILESPEYQIF